MVGGGVLVKTLIGIDYEFSVIAVGALMLAYVVFGGMVATTYVQIVKAVLLVIASLVLVTLVWMPYGFSLPAFLQAVVDDSQDSCASGEIAWCGGRNDDAARTWSMFSEPGLFFKDPIDQISLGMALVFGTSGLPHIFMRFFTVPNAREARKSVVWAMAIIGGFYVLTLFLALAQPCTWALKTLAASIKVAIWLRLCWRSIWMTDKTHSWTILCWLLWRL